MALEQDQSAYEEAAPCDCHEQDGVTVGGLGPRRSGGGVVQALRATLRAGRRGA
jgi:hypothetical protein